MIDQSDITAWIRPEDANHPKLDRLRRSVHVAVGHDDDVSLPWVAWGHGLSRAWLFPKLEAGAQVLILPPWTEGGFAGLPPFRVVADPPARLQLGDALYTVSATCGIEPTPAWQEYGRFEQSKTAWLVAHEPFVGAGRAWLCTAELLVATPTTRPKESRSLTLDLVSFVGSHCERAKKPATSDARGVTPKLSGFTRDDVPYLLAFLGMQRPQDAAQTAQFVSRRLGLQPDVMVLERLLAQPEVKRELQHPIGKRERLAKIVDDFGFRSFRIEIEETVS